MDSLKPVPYQSLIKIFEEEGFVYDRTSGDHLIYIRPGIKRPLVIPKYKSVPVFVIKNLIRTAGITRERFFSLLKNQS
jgi:predicted RNA binding protein YcfA (HicA-like mRNA interferase family)